MVISVVGSASRVPGRMGVASLLPHLRHGQSRGGVTTSRETDVWLDQPIQPPVPGTNCLSNPKEAIMTRIPHKDCLLAGVPLGCFLLPRTLLTTCSRSMLITM